MLRAVQQTPHLGAEPYFELDSTDRVLLKATLSAGGGLFCDIFWPLANGGAAVVAKPGGQRDTSYLVDLIARERVTLMHVVPTILLPLLEEPDLKRCSTLRHVICSGEPLSVLCQNSALLK